MCVEVDRSNRLRYLPNFCGKLHVAVNNEYLLYIDIYKTWDYVVFKMARFPRGLQGTLFRIMKRYISTSLPKPHERML